MLMIVIVSSTAQVWTDIYGFKTGGNRISALKCDRDGGVLMGGSWVDSLRIFDTTIVTVEYADCFVIKIDTVGRISSLTRFGGPGFDYVYDLGIKKNGSVVVTGTFQKSMTVGDSNIIAPTYDAMFLAEFGDGPTPRWLTKALAYSGKSLAVLDNGDIFVAGQMGDTAVFGKADTLFGRGRQDFFTALYSPAGDLRWVRSGGGEDDDFAKKVAVGRNNALYFAGTFKDTILFDSDTLYPLSESFQSFAARLDTAGNTVWVLPIVGDAKAIVEELAIDNTDNLYVTGNFAGSLTIDTIALSANNEFEFFLAALTTDGHVRWVQHAEIASGTDIAFGKNNELFVTGNFDRRTTFGTYIIEAVAVEDIFVGNYSSDGICNWVITAGGCRSSIGWRIAANERNIFLSGEVDVNRSCSSCPMQFGELETTYTSEDYGRSFLAIVDYTIKNSVNRPIGHRLPYVQTARGLQRYFDLSGRELHAIPGRSLLQQRATGSFARQAVISQTGGRGKLFVDVR